MPHGSGGNVVWAVLVSYGKHQTLTPAKIQSPNPIATKLGLRHYVIRVSTMPNLVKIAPPVASRQLRDLSHFCDFSSYFIFAVTRTAQTESPIVTVDGSNDAFWWKGMPFIHFGHVNLRFGVTVPQKGADLPPNRNFPA